jgi:hypothetical protein
MHCCYRWWNGRVEGGSEGWKWRMKVIVVWVYVVRGGEIPLRNLWEYSGWESVMRELMIAMNTETTLGVLLHAIVLLGYCLHQPTVLSVIVCLLSVTVPITKVTHHISIHVLGNPCLLETQVPKWQQHAADIVHYVRGRTTCRGIRHILTSHFFIHSHCHCHMCVCSIVLFTCIYR